MTTKLNLIESGESSLGVVSSATIIGSTIVLGAATIASIWSLLSPAGDLVATINRRVLLAIRH